MKPPYRNELLPGCSNESEAWEQFLSASQAGCTEALRRGPSLTHLNFLGSVSLQEAAPA